MSYFAENSKAGQRAEERFRLARAAAKIGMWEWDPVTGNSVLSPELHSMFGTIPSESDHMKLWSSRLHPEDLVRIPSLFAEAQRTGFMEFEYRFNHPVDGLRWFYCKGARMHNKSRMYGIVMDITERRINDEAALRLAAIVQSSDDAIVSKDLNGIVMSWNEGAQKMFGYTPEEIIGKPITTIIPVELHGDEDLILSKIRRGERIDHFETVRVAKSGERIHVSLTVSPVKDATGKVIGAAKIARDVTQRIKTEEALRTSEKLASVGRLAATVAHEINNPLAAVVNLVYLIKNSPELPASLAQYVKIIEEELARISSLTRQTLGFYREDRGASPTHVGEIARKIARIFAPKIRNKSINLRVQLRSDPEINAVAGEIRQLISNLLGNSVDAVRPGGCITLRIAAATLRANGRSLPAVRLTVADSGPGIPAQIRARMFEPFFTTKQDVGTGLGLWICRSIIEKHSGIIRVRTCTLPGKTWTVFSIVIPQENSVAPENQHVGVPASRTA